MNPDFWITVLLTALSGAFGGLIFELIALQGNLELPHRGTGDEASKSSLPYATASRLLDLGFLARVIIGAGAAVAVTLLIAPPSTIKLVATSVVAGSAGISVFRSMQDRLLATLSQRDAAQVRAKSAKAGSKVKEAQTAIRSARGAPSAAAGTTRTFGGTGSAEASGLDRADQLLSEASAMYEDVDA